MFPVSDILIFSRLCYNVLVSFAFVVGIILMVSPEAYKVFNSDLQKEYGMKKKIVPKLEDPLTDAIDRLILRYRVFAGAAISTISFILILIYK